MDLASWLCAENVTVSVGVVAKFSSTLSPVRKMQRCTSSLLEITRRGNSSCLQRGPNEELLASVAWQRPLTLTLTRSHSSRQPWPRSCECGWRQAVFTLSVLSLPIDRPAAETSSSSFVNRADGTTGRFCETVSFGTDGTRPSRACVSGSGPFALHMLKNIGRCPGSLPQPAVFQRPAQKRCVRHRHNACDVSSCLVFIANGVLEK